MKRILMAAAMLAMLAPSVADARTQAQLDCAVQRAPAGLGDSLAAAMVAGDRARLSPLQQQLERVVRQCLPITRLTDREAEVYYDYALARLPREALSRQLARAGVVTARIDAAMGFGPGRANAAMRDMDEAAGARAAAEMAAGGIDEQRLSAANWSKVMTYIDLTPRMYRYLDRLK
jgi:hypothetical protein